MVSNRFIVSLCLETVFRVKKVPIHAYLGVITRISVDKYNKEIMMKKLILFGFLVIFSPIKSNSSSDVSLVDKYLTKQSPRELRLYFMVKSQLKTRDERLFFLNLSIQDKAIYTRYLLGDSKVSFSRSRSSFTLF